MKTAASHNMKPSELICQGLWGECFWRDLTYYSDSIVKFTSSGGLQINDLNQRNDVDKFQLAVKISVTSHSYYFKLLTVDERKFTSKS